VVARKPGRSGRQWLNGRRSRRRFPPDLTAQPSAGVVNGARSSGPPESARASSAGAGTNRGTRRPMSGPGMLNSHLQRARIVKHAGGRLRPGAGHGTRCSCVPLTRADFRSGFRRSCPSWPKVGRPALFRCPGVQRNQPLLRAQIDARRVGWIHDISSSNAARTTLLCGLSSRQQTASIVFDRDVRRSRHCRQTPTEGACTAAPACQRANGAVVPRPCGNDVIEQPCARGRGVCRSRQCHLQRSAMTVRFPAGTISSNSPWSRTRMPC